jgi:hypothetical protein
MANTWRNTRKGARVELGLIQVDIVHHSQLVGSDHTLQEAKSIFREHMEGIACIRKGKLFNWAGDGGAFMFLMGTRGSFNMLGFSAIQMLINLPAINEEITMYTDLNTPIAVRISCDVGVATYHTDPGRITADFINRFLKYERVISLPNTVCITERVWTQISPRLRGKFRAFKYCAEVVSQIYSYSWQECQLMMKNMAPDQCHRTRDSESISLETPSLPIRQETEPLAKFAVKPSLPYFSAL